ncbi:MAG: LPS assembly lipoprotein LptE [Gammaproteobacteria bacterium]|nr:LPS assembly lipoprotein LptE [Gammaproteobacteria bacterium]
MRSPWLRLAALAAGLMLLAGCGFHLRDALDLGPELARVHITGDDREMVGHLSRVLEQRGVVIADSAHRAAVIDVSGRGFERAALTTDSRGRASAYELHYQVAFSVTGADGEALHPAHTITISRAFDYDPARQLQSEAETRFLETAMRREMAVRILQYLARR